MADNCGVIDRLGVIVSSPLPVQNTADAPVLYTFAADELIVLELAMFDDGTAVIGLLA